MSRVCLLFTLFVFCTTVVGKDTPYAIGSVINDRVTVYAADGTPQLLRSLLQAQAAPINVIFIFGGGGMGHERTRNTGGLWCADSFEDLYILRSLRAVYGEQLGIFPIAIPAAHHMLRFGFDKDVFLHPDTDSSDYQNAVSAFINSTQAAVEAATIPVQPFYDTRYNLMISAEDLSNRNTDQAWHGAFRAVDERQTYGVPSLWLVSRDGRILHEPFRGNDYHAHGGKVVVKYTLSEVISAVDNLTHKRPD